MKNTARKKRPTEDARPQLRAVFSAAARDAQLALDLGDLLRRDLREFVITAGITALATVLERERTEIVGPRMRTCRRDVPIAQARRRVSW